MKKYLQKYNTLYTMVTVDKNYIFLNLRLSQNWQHNKPLETVVPIDNIRLHLYHNIGYIEKA